MQCPNCGGTNPEYRRVCEYCGTFLKRPPLTEEEEELRNQLLSMSLGSEDLSTICFSLGLYWHELEEEPDEATRTEMMVRMLADDGRLGEVGHSLHDFRFAGSYAPLPGPYPDNMWLTYVFAVQAITSMAQLEELCAHAGLGPASTLPGEALPHKIREALRTAHRYDKLPLVHEWLRQLRPQQGLQRPRRRRRQ